MKKILILVIAALVIFGGCNEKTKKEYKLEITYDIEMGTVQKVPNKAVYKEGERVQLIGTPKAGYEFVSWSGTNGKEVVNNSIVMSGDKSIYAGFKKEGYKLFVKIIPENFAMGGVTPQKEMYSKNDSVNITVTPDEGYEVVSWEGLPEIKGSTNQAINIVITTDTALTCFVQPKKYKLTLTATNGTVNATPSAIDSMYNYGEEVKLIPVPNTGYVFTGWTGANGSEVTTGNVIKINGNKNITAVFGVEKPQYTLLCTGTNGKITINPVKTKYTEGEIVSVAFTPNAGYEFTGWGGKDGSKVINDKITITGDLVIEAMSVIKQYTLNIMGVSGGSITKTPDKTKYDHGEIVTLTTLPADGYEFRFWSGTNAGEVVNNKITMNGDKVVTPVFGKQGINESLSAEHEFEADNTLNEYFIYIYGDQTLDKEENYTKYGNLDNYEAYTYENGKKSMEKQYNQENVLKSTIKYTYNDDGTLQKEQEYDGTGVLVRYYIYTYTNGVKTKRDRYTGAGIKDKYWQYEYTAEKHIGTKEYDASGILLESKVYEYTGENLAKETVKNGSGARVQYYTYEYDGNSYLRTKKRFSDGNIMEKYWKYYYGAEAAVNLPPLQIKKDVWDTDADYEAVFAEGILNEINIDMTQAEWNAFISNVSSNSKSDTYFKSKFTFIGKNGTATMENVGFRIRGNSTRVVPQQGSNFYKAHFKLKFDETFSFPVGSTDYNNLNNRSFAKVSALNLKATSLVNQWGDSNNDNTRISELYSYKIMDEVGLNTPKTGVAKVYIIIGGVKHYFGVYNMLESIDKDFITKRLGKENNDGNLYKCLYQNLGPATLESGTINNTSNTDTEGKFAYYLTTNKTTPNYADIKAFITNINSKSGADLKTYLDASFNIDNFIKNLAMDVLTGNPDNYWSMGNNYYLYFNPNGKIEFIQYDYDNSLGNCWSGYATVPYDGKHSWDVDIYRFMEMMGKQGILAKKVLEIPEYKALFKNYLGQYVNQNTGVFTYSKYLTYYNSMYSLIYSSLSNETYMNAGSTMDKSTTESYFTKKIASVTEQLNSTPIDPNNTMYIRGIFNGWGSTAMTFKGNNIWEATVSFPAGEQKFKFDRYADWSENYGDDNMDGIAGQSEDDIIVSSNTTYLITFNLTTLQYTLTQK